MADPTPPETLPARQALTGAPATDPATPPRPSALAARGRLTRYLFIAQVSLIVVTGALFAASFSFESVGFFWFAFIAGIFGASIALLRRIQEGVADGAPATWMTVLMPLLYGALMAGVTYFLFASGLLTGATGDGLITTNLFPCFEHTCDGAEPDVRLSAWRDLSLSTIADSGKLLIWCFVAGYSEGFVTRILDRLDSQSQT